MKEPIIYVKIALNLIIAVIVVLFLFMVMPRVIGFFLPFVIGWIIAMIANPLVKFLEKRVKILRKHSSAIIIIFAIVFIAGIAYLAIGKLVKEASQLSAEIHNLTDGFAALLDDASERVRTLWRSLPANIQSHIDIDKITEAIENSLNGLLSGIKLPSISLVGSVVRNVAEGFMFSIVTLLSAYFFAAGRNELVAGFRKILPKSATESWMIIYGNFKSVVGGYFKAQFKIMLLLMVVMFVGFEILRVDYSFLLALGIAFIDFLPILGAGAVLWPWALIELIAGNYMNAIGLLVIYLLCQILKQVLQPKMVGESIGLHPLATLVFMYIGYRFYGFIGMIFGVPIGMVIVNLYRLGTFERLIRGFKIIVQDLNNFRKF